MTQDQPTIDNPQFPNTSVKNTRFSHAAEENFARILDYYGIEWEYEPRTFPLRWDDNGSIIEAFSPDFYLPGQDLYVELTTLRPELTTKKNRKIARLKELYPEINIKLFKRRELRDLMVKYGLDQEAQTFNGNRVTGSEQEGPIQGGLI
jgi:hypothetical protein